MYKKIFYEKFVRVKNFDVLCLKLEREMKITKDLIITKENQNDYKKLKEAGNIYLRQGATLDAPLLATSGNIYLSEGATLDAPLLATSGYIDLSEGATLDAPLLATSGNIYLRQGATLDAPLLATSGYIDLSEGATLDAPLLATSGNIDLSEGATLDAPLLATSGYIYLSEGATLNTNKTKHLNYKSVDNSMFIIQSEKSSKGIKIYSGYNLNKFDKGEIIKTNCYVVEKGDFYAHGETIKKAIDDLNFKIVSEKLKKEPILADTLISVNHYRLITGACEMGCNEWMKQNGITKEKYKAKDLLPILEKTNAYGLEKFKSLVSF